MWLYETISALQDLYHKTEKKENIKRLYIIIINISLLPFFFFPFFPLHPFFLIPSFSFSRKMRDYKNLQIIHSYFDIFLRTFSFRATIKRIKQLFCPSRIYTNSHVRARIFCSVKFLSLNKHEILKLNIQTYRWVNAKKNKHFLIIPREEWRSRSEVIFVEVF